jgi:hypothetical protein
MVAGIIAGFVIGVIASLLWRRAEYPKEQRWHWASRLPVYEHRDQRAALGQMRPVAFLAAPKSKIQFNGVGGLPTYISFTQGADDMSDHDKWISYSHWGMFPTGKKYSK